MTSESHASQVAMGEPELTKALAILDATLENPVVWSRTNESYDIVLDHEEESFTRGIEHLVVLSASGNGQQLRSVLRNPSPIALERAAKSLAAHSDSPWLKLPEPTEHAWRATWSRNHTDYRNRVRTLFENARAVGGSRVIYRSAQLRSVHTQTQLMSPNRHLRAKAQRTRGGLVMGAWARGEIATGFAEASGQGGPGLVSLPTDRIAEVAESCLAHLHARSSPEEGAQSILLSPDAAALLAFEAVAKSRTPHKVGSATSALRVIDAPERGYGAMAFDDEGVPSIAHTLVGANASPLPRASRTRYDHRGQLATRPTHVSIEAGVEDLDALVERIQNGVFLEGPEHCHLSRDGERFALQCSRAREIRGGRFTGRLFARTLATGVLSDFLSDTVALGHTRNTLAFDGAGYGGSAEAPHWLSSAGVSGV